MATYAIIRRELDKLAVLLQRPIPDADVEVIARTWAETFRDMADADFSAALRHFRQGSSYWPTEADIVKAHNERPKPRPAALPERAWTGDDRRWNAICAAMLLPSVNGDAGARAFFRGGLSRPEREALAREVLGERHPDCRRGDWDRVRPGRASAPGPRKLSEAL